MKIERKSNAQLIAFALTAGLLSVIQLAPQTPLLLAERFWPGAGWLQIMLISSYSYWLTGIFSNPGQAKKFRPVIWLLFSILFFAQLALGLAGYERFLMSGKLHLPIPAMIIAGPLYRGEGFFMPILLLATLLLVGPAWCSHLCYIGAWEDFLSRKSKKKHSLPKQHNLVRGTILAFVILSALSMKSLGLSSFSATISAIFFGSVGIGIILLVSSRNGAMNHCLSYCPIGFINAFVGKISPFRIRIGDECSECMACSKSCKYQALSLEDIRNKKAGFNCTLCGDCVSACKHRQIGYHLPMSSAGFARQAFVVLIVSLHSLFLAVARI